MQTQISLNETLDRIGFENLLDSEQFDLIGILAFYGALEGEEAELPLDDVMDASDLEFSEDVAIAVQAISNLQLPTYDVQTLVTIGAAQIPVPATQTLEETAEQVRAIGFYELSTPERFELIGILSFHAAVDVIQSIAETMESTGFQFSGEVNGTADEVSRLTKYSLDQAEPIVEQIVVFCASQVFA